MRCTAKSKRTGEQCKRYTAPGATVCWWHGAAAKQVKIGAERRVERAKAEQAVATYGLPREIDPHTALLEEVWRTAGHVAWLAAVVTSLEAGDLPRSGYVGLYRDERDRLVRVAKAAVEAGVAERAVRLAEDQARELARIVSAILEDLGHDLQEERTREVVRLRLLEGGKAA